SVIAAALSAFASSHMRASQDLDAKVGVRRAHRLGRHRHEAVPGHPRRRVDLEERPRAVGAEDEVEPAPARAADDVEGREGLRADRALHCVGEPARAVVARVDCPCGLADAMESAIRAQSLAAFDIIGCSGWGRLDLILRADGTWTFLEVNTSPGMTGHSLVPMAAKAMGTSYADLCVEILRGAHVG